MLVHQPQLVSQHVGAVASKWQLVGALVHGHAGWAEQLAGCGPADRAWLLCLPYMTVARLRFLADYGLQVGGRGAVGGKAGEASPGRVRVRGCGDDWLCGCAV